MEVIAYGSPKSECKRCREAEGVVEDVLKELGPGAGIRYRKLTLKDPEAAEHGVLVTPSLVVDGEIVVDGNVPNRAKLMAYLRERLG